MSLAVGLRAWQCVPVAQTVTLDQAQFQSSGVSQATSQTVVEHQTGLMSSIAGASDTLWAYTQSTSATQLTGQGTSAGITLQCPASEGEYAVPIYYGNFAFRFAGLPRAAATLTAGDSSSWIQLRGARLRGLKLKLR